MGLCGSEPLAWPLCCLALLLVNVLIVDSACGSKRRSVAMVAAATLGWHAAASWWVVLAVHQTDRWTAAWQLTVLAVMVLAQVLWFSLAWWALLSACRRSETPTLTKAAFSWCVAFAAADVLRQIGWSGNPYGSLGVALIDVPGAQTLVPMIGTQGLAWAAMAVTSAGAVARLSPAGGLPAWRNVGIACAALMVTTGLVQAAPQVLDSTAAEQPAELTLVVLQPRIIGRGKWNESVRDKALASLFGVIEQSAPGSLVITPESYLYEPPPSQPVGLWGDLLSKVEQAQVHVLLGMPFLWRGSESVQRLNAAVHLAPGRQAVYAKERLVPGAEYMPLQDWLGPLYRRLLDHEGRSEEPGPAELRAPLYVQGTDVGTSICYELGFPLTMAQRARNAGLLVNLSLDGWIPSSVFRHQMLAIARARALESSRSLLRATDNGGSLLIDHLGRIQAPTRIQGDVVVFDQVRARQGRTLYNTLSGWMALVPLLVAGVLLVHALARGTFRIRMFRRSPT